MAASLVALAGAALAGCGAGGSGGWEDLERVERDEWSIREGTFSPDGEHLAVLLSDENARPRAGLVEAGGVRVLGGEDLRPTALAWLPDSSGLVVTNHMSDIDHLGEPERLVIVDLEGGIVHTVDPEMPLIGGAGLVCAVLIPEGNVALGKLA
ncbi:MAG: hypothetical protein GEU78_20385, partial [Actinobacteria bacterium]|nr:hypothetical protein [Actinomycetota bacterium]